MLSLASLQIVRFPALSGLKTALTQSVLARNISRMRQQRIPRHLFRPWCSSRVISEAQATEVQSCIRRQKSPEALTLYRKIGEFRTGPKTNTRLSFCMFDGSLLLSCIMTHYLQRGLICTNFRHIFRGRRAVEFSQHYSNGTTKTPLNISLRWSQHVHDSALNTHLRSNSRSVSQPF